MRGSKTKKDKKIAVVKAKLKDPSATLKEITEKTGVPTSTAADIINNIPEEVRKSSATGGLMVDKLDDIINDIVDITKNSLKWFTKKSKNDELSTKEVRDLSGIAKDTFDRKQILEWNPTEITNMNIDLSSKNPKELMEYIKSVMNAKR